MGKRYRCRSEKNGILKKAALSAAGCLLLAGIGTAAVAVMGNSSGASQAAEEEEQEERDYDQILNGAKYVKKKNLETYLFMGIDDYKEVGKKTEYDGTGQCDALFLMVRDIGAGTYRTLAIDRNTMVDMNVLEDDGTYSGTTVGQIALSHAMGDGMEGSCENTVDAVSNLLYGQEIDGYVAINMGAIRTINHLIGGASVTIEDDLTAEDPLMVPGATLTLTDDQAEIFVRGRMSVADGTNENRMSRQAQYLEAAKPRFSELCLADASFPKQVYEALQDYMVTDITMQKFTKLALLLAKEESQEQLSISGTSEEGRFGFVEFTPDPESLQEVTAQLFYKECEE